ncbi:hypothetical protein [Nocardia cyriacigeorgica]|uniref:hypothetical protein n=1 Tax=Nocardia cyriacigeorgica TaxID=135487 RepID=UPI0024569639|nr:hypothetical protein [Nocardia cyriacigeorgica]
MGFVQIGVVVCAVLARWTAAGWFLLIGVLATLGLLPLLLLGPLIFAGFLAPSQAWPLLVVADVLLLTSALTLADGGDNGPLIPILDDKTANSSTGDKVHRIGTITGLAYLLTLIALMAWTLSG